MTDPLLFLLAVATLLAAPGPTNTLLAMSGASVGLARSVPLIAGGIAGYLIAIFAIRLVVAPVIAVYPLAGSGLKILVAVYLVWLAIKLWRQPLSPVSGTRSVGVLGIFIATLLNPKALIFALSIFPSENTPALVWYVLGFVTIVIVTGASWVGLGSVLRGASGDRAGYIPKIASVALVGFAGIIAGSLI